MDPAAIGLRPHTGWAALVAVGGPLASPIVLDRRRLELVDDTVARHVYHDARELELPDAEELVRRVARGACAAAERELGEVTADLRRSGHTVVTVGIAAQVRRLPPLAKIVASHTLVHSAEGELYRAALADAARAGGLEVHLVAPPDAYAAVAGALGIDASRLAAQLGDMRRDLGPPWRKDQKEATAVALAALAASSAAEPRAAPPRHVVLVGTMGAGKTTVGRLLAGRLGRPLVDSDPEIEARTGRTVAEIDRADGAEAMHRLEADVLLEGVDAPEPSVIAAAASVVTDERVLDALRSRGVTVVWLRARPRTLRRRALAGTHRPFVHGDPDAVARLDAARAPLYEQVADLTVDVDDAEPEATAREITAALAAGDRA